MGGGLVHGRPANGQGHPRRWVSLGVLVQRTRWSYQAEKDLTANQAAKIATMLGADGVLITSDAGGNDFVEVALTVIEASAWRARTDAYCRAL